jgi:MFS family permease
MPSGQITNHESRITGSWLTRNVVALGLVSLLTDVASEMAVPLLPAFLTLVLGAGALSLGLIEGAADSVASLLKLFSGHWADRMGRHRPLVIAGYSLSSAVRPLLALAAAPWHVLAVRVTDRVGKGLRTSPRDALLAASVQQEQRGAAFSLHRGMDHAGAALGPLIAVAVLELWTRDLRILFWLTAIPGALSVIALIVGVRERAARPTVSAVPPRLLGALDPSLLRFLVPLGIITLGRASETFLLLKAGAARAPLVSLPLFWMALHVAKALLATPGGLLADRWGRRTAISLGWAVFVLVSVGLAFAESKVTLGLLFLGYAVYTALTEGAEKAFIAELAPAATRGTVFGWYNLTVGLLALPANLLFGLLWEMGGVEAAFLTSAGLAAVGLVCFAVLLRPRGDGGVRFLSSVSQ